MSCIIIVGGQYGSEGKGKVVALEASRRSNPWVVRCGGPNSGHTVSIGGNNFVLRQIPAGVVHPESVLLLSAGCVVDEQILLCEIERLNLSRDRVIVDPRAVLLGESDRRAETEKINSIGSTASGTGEALMRRMLRSGEVILVGDSEELRKAVRVEAVAPLLHAHLDKGGDVIVEGTQGFGLSLLHGPHYPFVTSRDTTASAFASEVGLSPRQVDEVVMVLRTFPIRVGGNSGPLASEISWEDVRALSGAPEVVPEYTSVTRRLRRVSLFNLQDVQAACTYNRPTSLALMGLDRLDYLNVGARERAELSRRACDFMQWLERGTGVRVGWVGTGFSTLDALNLLDQKEGMNESSFYYAASSS